MGPDHVVTRRSLDVPASLEGNLPALATEIVPIVNLHLDSKFLAKHRAEIDARLTDAALCLERGERVFGINRALHIASSVVLNGSVDLQPVLDTVSTNDRFRDADAPTIVTIAALHHLLKDAPTQAAAAIRSGFQSESWLIGADKAAALETSPRA